MEFRSLYPIPAKSLIIPHLIYLFTTFIITFEINPIKNKIADLTDRTSVLRGYL
ncbi:hypothetical protein HMPREF9996_02264 [Aggregatibacter actinomycetemcomitans Y4]|nr:hypothetical protein HMPREF9996_02264 [Aggregatibacter actinomycetemcomitans Y4]